MWLLLLVPLVIVAIVVLSLGALFAGVFWVLGAGWPVLLIGLGVWMFLHEDGRHTRRFRAATPTAHAGQQATQPRPGRRSSEAQASSRLLRNSGLPADVQAKVEQISKKVDVLLSYADRFPPFSQDLYLVRQTTSDYLPRTINAYLALQRQTDGDRLVSPDGRTAYQELKAQLDLLESKLDVIGQDLKRQDTDQLLANRRFLEDRFATRAATAKPVAESSATTGVA